MKEINPVKELSDQLVAAFDHLNRGLFDGKLSRPMVMFTRSSKIIGGYFSEKKWFDENGNAAHEITINANHMVEGDEIQLYEILVHEMSHQWQYEHGTPGRGGYHNREWADKALEIGLLPVSADSPEVQTGDKISTSLIPGGRAMKSIADMPEEIEIPWYAVPMVDPDAKAPTPEPKKPEGDDSPPPEPKQGRKTKYTCSKCGFNLWGKGGGKIQCVPCGIMFTETK